VTAPIPVGSPRVVSFGVVVADVFVPPLERLPDAGELLTTGDFLIEPGGCAANVAIALGKLGVPAAVGGRVGDDVFGEVVRRELAARGVETSGLLTTPGIGTSKTVIVPVVGEDRRYLHTFGANAALTADDFSATTFETAEVIYVGGYLILPSLHDDELARRLAEAKARGAATILDVVSPSRADQSLAAVSRLLPLVDYFIPNLDEARALTGRAEPELQAEELIAHGARTVMIKLGEKGLYVRSEEGAFALDAPPVHVVEPSGAGDAFAAGLAVGILEGWELERKARFASVMGGSACTALGCADGVFTRAEADAFLAAHPLNRI
jgi:sugar/nucleoside kinase (ribokinase family)